MSGDSFRIAMISNYLPSGSKIGVGYQADALARGLVDHGHYVDMFSACPPMPEAQYGQHWIDLSGPLRTFRFALALRDVEFSSYDVIHAHGDDYWLWRRRAGAHVRTMHGSCFEEALRARGAGGRLRMVALGLSELLATIVADETVAVSPATRRWTPWVRRVIPNGVDLSRFHPDPQMRAGHPVVLFVGTWHGRKRGAALATEFASHVRPRIPTAELWMVTQDAPKDPGAGIRILGRVSDADLAELYQMAWLFCLPSSYEGFGIPYIEAMASGLPIVSTPNIGVRYVSQEGRSALLTRLDGLGIAIADLLGDSGALGRYSAAGLLRARDFALSNIIADYENLYRELCERGRI